MRIVVAAVGRLKAGAERELAERYRDRAVKTGRSLGIRDIEIIEVKDSRAREPERRVLEESIALASVVPDGAAVIALDPRGESLSSESFTAHLRSLSQSGRTSAFFAIGGADGLGEAVRARADLTLAFGTSTWPHQLVRIMLLEQIYRAFTILSGHPYHRE
jgi:23S rRNA (pseudouridine1915-N3)-methyltransferase